MENFEEMFEESLKYIKTNTVIEGEVISITDDEMFVNIGYKADGIISKNDFSYDENEKFSDKYKVGDKIQVFVVKLNDGRGNVILSTKKLQEDIKKQEFQQRIDNNQIIDGKVSEVLEKGIRINCNGVKVFIPGSQLVEKDIKSYQGKNVLFKIIENERNRVIGSEKIAAREQRKELATETLNSIRVGSIVKGIVRRVNEYGAFVDIGGIEGLLHVSQMTWKRHVNPSDFVKEGDQIDVEIMSIEEETNKISLKTKKDDDNPWNKVGNEISLDSVLGVTVLKLVPFGAFVEIIDGLEGFIHISQISTKMIEKPSDALNIGDVVNAKVILIDAENKKIELSIKALQEDNRNIEDAIKENEEN